MEYLFFIIVNIFTRILPHVPNVTSVGATALFLSSAYSWKKSFAVTAFTMIISDILLGFHAIMWATYGSFLITVFLGTLLQKKKTVSWILGVTLVSSLQFFIITNFAVWMTGTLYPKTISGLLECYIMALPFFRNTVMGDIGYTILIFGCFEIIKSIRQKSVTSLA